MLWQEEFRAIGRDPNETGRLFWNLGMLDLSLDHSDRTIEDKTRVRLSIVEDRNLLALLDGYRVNTGEFIDVWGGIFRKLPETTRTQTARGFLADQSILLTVAKGHLGSATWRFLERLTDALPESGRNEAIQALLDNDELLLAPRTGHREFIVDGLIDHLPPDERARQTLRLLTERPKLYERIGEGGDYDLLSVMQRNIIPSSLAMSLVTKLFHEQAVALLRHQTAHETQLKDPNAQQLLVCQATSDEAADAFRGELNYKIRKENAWRHFARGWGLSGGNAAERFEQSFAESERCRERDLSRRARNAMTRAP